MNIKEYAWVQLTEKGRAAYARHLKLEPGDSEVMVDQNGFHKFPLWKLMYIFGGGKDTDAREMFSQDEVFFAHEAQVAES